MDHRGRSARGPLARRCRLRRRRRRRGGGQRERQDGNAEAHGQQAGRQADRAVDRRRRLTSTAARPTTRWATSSARRRRGRCTPTSPTTRSTCSPGPRRRPRRRSPRTARPSRSRSSRASSTRRRTTARSRPKDVKYAIERGFFNSVANGFTPSYYGDLEGAKVGVKPGTKISGIETPDDSHDRAEVQARRRRRDGRGRARASRPRRPCPRSTRRSSTPRPPSTYGENQLATGPYMIENDAAGKAIGYEPGKRIHLVRNPNWDKSPGLQAGVPGRDRQPRGQRRSRRRLAPHPRRREHGQRRLIAAAGEPQAGARGHARDQLVLVPAGRRPLGRR